MKELLAKIIPLLYGQWLNFIALFNSQKAAKIAFDIFCTIRKGQVRPEQKDFLDAAKFTVEDVMEQQIQTYRWPGSKETVLLLHGWESNTHRWRNLIKKLQEQDFEILAFDAPAHGYSTGEMLHVPLYAHSLRHILDKFQPKRVVAHSMGGMTILYDHFINPNSSVEKIVTIGSPCEFENFMHHYQSLLKFNNRVWKAMDKRLKIWFNFQVPGLLAITPLKDCYFTINWTNRLPIPNPFVFMNIGREANLYLPKGWGIPCIKKR